jgi:hypothetical protein
VTDQLAAWWELLSADSSIPVRSPYRGAGTGTTASDGEQGAHDGFVVVDPGALASRARCGCARR